MDKKTQQIVGAGAAVLVLISGYMLMYKSPAKTATNEMGTSTELTASVANAAESAKVGITGLPDGKTVTPNEIQGLIVANQAAGEAVALDALNVTAHTWAVVYDEEDGQPSWPMGAGLVWPGNQTFVVELVRATKVGHKYYVALIPDDGSKKFDLRTVRPNATSPVVSFVAR